MATTYRDLTDYERAALEAFAKAHGRKWRDELANVYWYNARIWRDASGSGAYGECLHGIRNQFGPTWLYEIYKPRRVA